MSRRPLRTAAATVAALAAVAVTGGCNVDVRVAIAADPDGGGTLRAEARLDAEAVAQLGGETPERRLALADLTAAGWKVSGPNRTADGGLEVAAEHGFADGGEARRLAEDLSGPDGPFREVDLGQRRSFLKTVSSFRSVVDLTDGLGAFTDPELREALAGPDGAPLGVTDQQLATRFGAPVDSLFDLEVTVDLPGDATTNAPTPEPVWRPALGERIVLEATSERWNVRNIVSAAVAVAAGTGLVGVLAGRRRASRRVGRPVDAPSPSEPFDQDQA